MGNAVRVEWVNEDKARQLFNRRRAAHVRKMMDQDPSNLKEHSLPDDDSLWDWVEIEECLETRRFPSVGMAMGWAEKHKDIDLYGAPRIMQTSWPDSDPEDVTETLSLEYVGDGEWLDTQSGETHTQAP